MKFSNSYFEKLLDRQNKALREPHQVICGDYANDGIVPQSLKYSLKGEIPGLLEKLKITLLITREYEHLVLGLSVKDGKLRQSFLHLPHPNGVAVNRATNKVYVASTRSPNKIVELSLANTFMPRTGYPAKKRNMNFLTPSRVKYYAGAYYFHDLAVINGKLYANSVGKNGIIEIDFNSSASEETIWSPLSGKFQNANYLQLNSIAAGKTIEESFFSASAEKPGKLRPGDRSFPVDKTGVIFDGRTKKAVARNLTRPHSAKLHQGKLWVLNSGYGEFGYIEKGHFKCVMQFRSWTRGLSFFGNIAFIGVSKIIPRYKVYAPGLKSDDHQCAVYAFDIKRNEIIGSIEWPYGNQIYGIEWLGSKLCSGFVYTGLQTSADDEKDFFLRHMI